MKATAHLSLLIALSLVAGCYGGSHGGLVLFPAAYPTGWDLSLEGSVLDIYGFPVADIAEPAELVLSPAGLDRYRVSFEGFLPFLVLDADFGNSLRWYDFPLRYLDGQTADYVPDPDFPGYGILRFDGFSTFQLGDLGHTEVELYLDLYPHGTTLEGSDFADLVWDAALYSSGTPFLPIPGHGRLSGFITVAVRFE